MPQQPAPSPRAVAPRAAPSSRAHRALQIVLTAPGSWQALSGSDHQLLCEQAAPYGPLFAWLDGQVLEHGPQPWSALREALRGHPLEDAAVRAIEGLHDEIDSDPGELQDILRQERPVHLKQRMDAALAAGDVALYQSLLPELARAKTGEREAGGY